MFTKKAFILSSLLAFASSVNAHFQMQYPTPRGVFVEDDEPNFCDGYTDAVNNRTEFPLGQAFMTINSEHPSWSAQVLISIEQDPTNFTVFNKSTSGITLPAAVPFFTTTGEGLACIALDIGSLNISGVKEGSNVTIQMQFSGGDGALYQCADLTLSSTATIPSDVNCSHLVDNATTSTASSSSTSASSTSSSGALPLLAEGSGLLGLLSVVALTLM